MSKALTLTGFRILMILPFLWACKSTQKVTVVDVMDVISGKVQIEHYYCGGAVPPNGATSWFDTLPNTKFIAFRDSLDSKIKYEFTTDEFGKFSLVIPVGKYQVFYAEKINSPQEFLKRKTKTGNFYKSAPPSCNDKWLKTPELTFHVGQEKSVVATITYKCFVADNPCLKYVGPAPP